MAGLDTLSSRQSFPAWLRGIVHTEAMMRLRSDGKRVSAVTLSEESPGVAAQDAQRHAAQQQRASRKGSFILACSAQRATRSDT